MSSAIGAQKYGMTGGPVQAARPLVAAVSNGAVAHGTAHPPVFSPDSPILWLLVIGAVTLGAVAVSTSVRIGPLHLAASAG